MVLMIAGARESAAALATDKADGARSGSACGDASEAALVVTDGEWIGRRIPLRDAPIIVGRGADVDLQIKDPTVSRHHCVIWCAAGRCWVRDLGSMNHTRVNNRLASLAELVEGDVVVIGQTALTFAWARQPDDDPRTPAGSSP